MTSSDKNKFLTPYQIYKRKKIKKILFEICFWFLVVGFLIVSIIELVVNSTAKQWVVFNKVIKIIQTIIVVFQFPLVLLKFRSVTSFVIRKYKNEKKAKEEWKEVIVKKNKGIINEVALAIKTKEASRSPEKRIKHNEQIAAILKASCGELLRGTPYYQIKDIMNSDGDKKEKIQKIVGVLKQNNIELNDNIKILLKNIA